MSMQLFLAPALALALAVDSSALNAQVTAPDSAHVVALDTVRRAARDTVPLAALQDSAVMRDARGRELALLAAQSRLRLANLRAASKPTLAVEGQAQYQSDVARIPITLPGGIKIPTPPHDTYDAHVAVGQKLYDPALGPQRAVEVAQAAEQEARLRAELYPVRQNVTDAYFVALRAQSQLAELQLGITDLEAQLKVASARVREGTALPSEEKSLQAEILRRSQSVADAKASRNASLVVLSDLTGQRFDSLTAFADPELGARVAAVRGSMDSITARPEYEQFARSRALLEEQERAQSAQALPRVSLFGRAGYGRPALNPLSDKFDSYWLAGVQLQWTPWNWGTTKREKEVLALQRQIVSAEEQAFTENLRRGTVQDLATIDRLAAALREDDEIVALREGIATETRARFNEGVVTSAEYVDRQTDVLSARTTRALHRVELAQARARFLNTLGIEAR